MIVFDLVCAPAGHVFEAWFGSGEDYAAQQIRGLVQCPLCGSGEVAKAAMAPRVPAKSNQRTGSTPPAGGAERQAVASAPVDAAAMKTMLRALAEAQAAAIAQSDYVGNRFAAEARAIHAGDADQRSIHGQASIDEVKSLLQDGVPVAPLPLPVRPPGRDN